MQKIPGIESNLAISYHLTSSRIFYIIIGSQPNIAATTTTNITFPASSRDICARSHGTAIVNANRRICNIIGIIRILPYCTC